ncbi:MAG: hypothetical protein K6D93_04210 [Saccharofermentans sp.]|nr:hypothetical protein [Saccharofermentans sp.]
MIPVYIFTGFLDSGKTSAVKDFIKGLQEKHHRKTLLLICEEGEEEFDENELLKQDVLARYIDDESLFNYEHTLELEKESDAQCVIVEYNGMWNVNRPRVIWDPEQIMEIMMVDASTFDMYLANLKALIADKIRSADLIMFNRCDNVHNNLPLYRRSARALNPKSTIVFRNNSGTIDFDPGDFLPYDPDADVIEIDDEAFAAFYIDATEKPDRYIGKEVVFTGMVLKSKQAQDRSFLLGRIAMTCCSEDLSTFAFICDCEGGIVLNTDEWLTITCIMDKDYSEKYDVWHPVCKVTEITRCDAPEEKIINVK